MAPDGSWGAATEPHINRAIAGAIASCKAMSGAQLGCGAYFTSIRAGWSLGIRCGREIIIVAEKILADAESRAIRRETELREVYVRDMPACVRVVMVDPNGVTAVARAGHSSRGFGQLDNFPFRKSCLTQCPLWVISGHSEIRTDVC